jgi:hypothetical protein
MKKFKLWLINFLVGDMSYVKNCIISGEVHVRPIHIVTSCCFLNGGCVVSFPRPDENTYK